MDIYLLGMISSLTDSEDAEIAANYGEAAAPGVRLIVTAAGLLIFFAALTLMGGG